MGRRINRLIQRGGSFKREFRQQIRMLIMLALAFTIAFAWRETTFNLSKSFVLFITQVKSSSLATILTSVFITLICVILILITTSALKDEN